MRVRRPGGERLVGVGMVAIQPTSRSPSHCHSGCRTRVHGRPDGSTVAALAQTIRWAISTNAGATSDRGCDMAVEPAMSRLTSGHVSIWSGGQRFAGSRRGLRRRPEPSRTTPPRGIQQTLPFALDGFQRQACSALEDGHGVLVCAPTGAGKTVVGEFAVFLALAGGSKCFYTTPIKALSNQKYADLVARHGAAAVGLLTGDTSVNGDAQVVVMTTEVLRNMIYAGLPARWSSWATWSWTRCTTWPTGSAARCGKR